MDIKRSKNTKKGGIDNSMENIFNNLGKDELEEIFKDYLGSKEIGIEVNSFKKYAEEIKNKYFNQVDYSLGICMNLVKKMFFEKIAYRYFTE